MPARSAALLRYLDPVPPPDVAVVEADGTVGRIPVLELRADRGDELVCLSMTGGTSRLLRDGPEDAQFPAEIDGEPGDVLGAAAGIGGDERGSPGFRRVGGIAQPVAGSPCRDPLLAADPLGDTVRDAAR